MVTVTTGRGRNSKVHDITKLSRDQMHTMTELTQLQMFGEVIHKKYDHSIHPHGRGPAKLNTKRLKITLKSGKEVWQPAGTEPAITRPGKEYPGGRSLRRSFTRLRRRRDGAPKGLRLPGSMKKEG